MEYYYARLIGRTLGSNTCKVQASSEAEAFEKATAILGTVNIRRWQPLRSNNV